MKKIALLSILIVAGSALLAAQAFRIDGIRAVQQTPCKVRFQVQYYINPKVRQACFIGAYIPSRAAMANFALNPAGRKPQGVPTGTHQFTDNIWFEMSYLGLEHYTSSKIEVVIYDSNGNLASTIINFRKTWKRFDIQGMKRIQTRPDSVKFQVQYFIDPSYNQPCFIGAHVPNNTVPSSAFAYRPAGLLPNGVPKGQVHFSDNVVVELRYVGSSGYTSTTLELSIYNSSGQTLRGQIINWGQSWRH